MALVIITPPAAAVLTAAEVKEYLRVTVSDEDTLIDRLIAAVTAWISGADGWLGRSLVNQTIELRLDGFPCDPCEGVPLPRPPFITVDSVKYLNSSGVEQTLGTDAYEAVRGVDGRGHLVLKPLKSWPATMRGRNSVAIRYLAGYGAAGTNVDAGLRHAIVMAVAHLFENRGDAGAIQGDVYMRALFAPYRVFG